MSTDVDGRQFETARTLLREFKGANYAFGLNCLDRLGALAGSLGKRAAVVAGGVGKDWGAALHGRIEAALASAGVSVAGPIIAGVRPNAPLEDLARIRQEIASRRPDVVVAAGAGSTIDAAKAAVAMLALGLSDVEPCFGVGQVTSLLAARGAKAIPVVAVQMAASSAAHLTKYSNITDLATGQKKLIVDDAIVPARALFDYAMTTTMSRSFTADGALDGVSHAIEVFYGLKGDALAKVQPISALAVELIVGHLKRACADGQDLAAREALGLGTDLGGYCIMVGSTNGAHLTSFSLVDILPHGRARALMNPYYTVFFAPAIEPQLRVIGAILAKSGYVKGELSCLHGRNLGLAVAEAMVSLARDVGFPTTLSQVPRFTPAHVQRALSAAKNPQLEMKLKAMPVPLSAATVDQYMGPVLEAAATGDFSRIRNM